MAVKTLNTRLKLKYAPLTEWESKNPILLAGEVAIATVTGADGAEVASPLIKVGDGTSNYNSLGYLYAKSMDVAAWAKAANKPEYALKEIVGLEAALNAKAAATDLEALEEVVAKQEDLEDLAGDVETLVADLDSLEALVGSLPEGTTAKDVVDYVNIKTAGIATDAALGELNSQVSGLQTSVQGILDDYLKGEHKTELEGKITAEKERAEGVEAGLDGRIEAIEKDYLKAADKYDDAALAARVKAIEDDYLTEEDKYDDTAVKGRLDVIERDFLKIADKYDDAEVRGLIGDNAKAIEDLEKVHADDKTELEGKIKANADAIVLLQGVDVETLADVENLVKYVEEHGSEVVQIQKDIKQNADDIDALEGRMGDAETALGTVDSRIEAAITGANLSQYALDSDLDAAVERIEALEVADAAQDELLAGLRTDVDAKAAQADLEGAVERVEVLENAGHQNAEQVGAAIDAKIAALDLANVYEAKGAAADALDAAKEHANGLNTAMNTRVEALEAIDHEHANKDVLDGITAAKVAAWDAAEANAKAHADGLDTAMDTRVKALEAKDAVLYTDELIIDCGGAEI